jgi:hypothetical protein
LLKPQNISGEWFDIGDDELVKIMNYCKENGLRLIKSNAQANRPSMNGVDVGTEKYDKMNEFYDWVYGGKRNLGDIL